jgi:hypothetical protein
MYKNVRNLSNLYNTYESNSQVIDRKIRLGVRQVDLTQIWYNHLPPIVKESEAKKESITKIIKDGKVRPLELSFVHDQDDLDLSMIKPVLKRSITH